MPDCDLLRRMDELATHERRTLVASLACLAEVDRRKLYADEGCPNLFVYCVRRLRFSEACAYRRVCAARAAEVRKEIYADLNSGELTLGVVALIASEMSGKDADEVLAAARGKSKRQVETWLAARRPAAPPPPDRVRAGPPLPAAQDRTERAGRDRGAAAESPREDHPRFFDTLSPPPAPTYQYSFTASAGLHRSIQRLKDLLWNKMPFGTLDDFLHEAVGDYLDRNDPELQLKVAAGPARPSSGRRVPKRVRRAVWARDGGRCSFVALDGGRCECRRGLELDHVRPFSLGGRSDDAANVRLLCREHNQLERRRKLGEGNDGDVHRFSPGKNEA